MMVRVVIIDDEQNAVNAIRVVLEEYCPEVEIVGFALSAKEGIKQIQTKNPDLVFVDVEMPQMTGIELMEQFRDRKFEVVFVTAYDKFAINAFKVNAANYLLKPIDIMDLVNAVNKIISKKNTTASVEQTNKLQLALSDKLALPTAKGAEYVVIKDIIRIEADGSYCKVYIINEKPRTITKNLKSLEEALQGESFLRCHNSHLINVQHIRKFNPGKEYANIEMIDGSDIPVSRRSKSDIVSLIKKYTR